MNSSRLYAPMGGAVYQLGRITLAFKRTDGDAEPGYSIAESIEPPGAGASLHRHPSFVETFIVCEGRYEFQVDANRYMLGPGESISIARGAAHALTSVGPETGRLLDITSPAGVFEAFIREVCRATSQTAAGESPVDFRGIALSHGIEFLT